MKRYVLPIIVFIILLLLVVSVYYRKNPIQPKVIINGNTFFLDVAVTNNEKEKGLGGVMSLDKNKGMIFPYDRKDYFPFWMKGMNFALDFIWIDGVTIVDITENVPVVTDGKYTTVRPSQPVDKIIEFNAGIVDEYGIKIGDRVVFEN